MRTLHFLPVSRFFMTSLLAVTAISQVAPAWAACSYKVTNNWGSGFTAEINVTNDTGQAVSNWSVSWQESGATVTNAWNATLSGSNPYTAASLGWNGTLAPGASASFGFQANGSAGAPGVNGTLCGTATSSVSSVSSTPVSSSSSVRSSSSSSSVQSSQALSTLTLQEVQAGFCRVDGIANESTNGGFTGTGYANTDNALGAAIVWAVAASTSSRYKLTVRFANGGSASRDGSLLINGGSNGNYTLSLPATGAWTTWQTVTVEVDLVQGNNLVQLTSRTADGLANIDYLRVEGASTTAGSCSGNTGSSVSSVRSSSSVASSSSSSQATGRMLTLDGNPAANWLNNARTKWSASRADVVLSYQQNNGGWPKNLDYNSVGNGGGGNESGTIDNGATITEMVFLAEVYKSGGNTKYRDAVRKAANFLVNSQYSTGALPQFYPLKGGYSDHATFNDNGMAYALTVLDFAANKRAPFDTDVFSDSDRTRFKTAVTKGTDYILKAQWKQNGVLTVWCAQHGALDYQPKKARAYELESLSGSESVGVLAFLMTQPQTAEIERAVRAGVAWFNSPRTYLEGYTYDSSLAATNPIVPRAGSKMWYRFYDLNTNRGFFSDRDGSKFYDITQMSLERRTGYSWGGNYGTSIINFAQKVGYL
ncbi:pectate lyase [Cellvibrio japonicus]|uniref:Pectate lyase, pel10A n=2 Tax=Cellvibrio japonicus TaxID=155077 RepID=B3PDE6_CELJU|nr:pectate lyase [Cellvibrio japonicus]AAG29353.1 pectate lyase [Cellvibrio japonicus]ACE85516.1 pectate lyase, pel10A [Cellvibrio japonicus Ueda107]QEI13396.1 pectate lyase [Cellvibrio japonicus]QEI16970.1 pectate lyase [Cellvibrio japonicus]QEI20548.1 pectate lyase [Cellvibrio japonicus]